MLYQNKLGVIVEGDISRDPEVKAAGSRNVLKINLRVKNEKKEDGTWDSQYVSADVWDNINQWDGMLQKGDHILVVGQRLDAREYNGKTYYNVVRPSIYPDGMVVFRWMEMLMQDMAPVPPDAQMAQTNEPTPFDLAEPQPQQITMDTAMYPGESLNDYAPRGRTRNSQDDTRLIETDAEDLPF